jgi:hypothetical protein
MNNEARITWNKDVCGDSVHEEIEIVFTGNAFENDIAFAVERFMRVAKCAGMVYNSDERIKT